MELIRDDNRVTKLVTKYMCQYILKNDRGVVILSTLL